MNNVYEGVPHAGVFVNGDELPLDPSLRLCNHSPTGFSWGYGGSGPAQLALAILLREYDDEEFALTHYQDFKWAVIAPLDMERRFTIASDAIARWFAARGVELTDHGYVDGLQGSDHGRTR